MNKNRNMFVAIAILVIVTSVLAFSVSGFVFAGWNYFNPSFKITFDSSKVSLQNVKKFEQVKALLKDYYYEDVEENKMLEGAIAGMAASIGDRYTVYYTKEQMEFMKEISQKSVDEFVGVGVNVTMNEEGLLVVTEPFEDSPAQIAGMLSGDKIVAVDGKDVTQIKDQDAIVRMIKGVAGTLVQIRIVRPKENRMIDFNITRQEIKYDINIKSKIIADNIGYIRIKTFNDANIDAIFGEHLSRLINDGMQALVIDVRDNPGGYYNQVVKIADRLLPKGVIVYTQDKSNKKEVESSDRSELGIPMALLINENSASASEVLAGALKDHDKAVLIGKKTFGKGIVQSIITLEDGSGLKLTTSKYYTPAGICIHGIGIQPDVEVSLLDEYQELPVFMIPQDDDAQLQKAIEVLK